VRYSYVPFPNARADSPGFLKFVGNKWDIFKDPRNIAIMACADGVQSFNDGIRTVTPMCFTIVNFPGELRCKREYVMTWGIWDGKPKISSKFYDLFALEVNRMTHGVRMFDVITNTIFTFKLVLYKLLEDYVGLSDAARRFGANSYMGCLKCWIRGTEKSKSGLTKIIYSSLHQGLPPGKHMNPSFFPFPSSAVRTEYVCTPCGHPTDSS
jgi:hypothetical protein